jgi:hypothetical protein
MPDISVQEVESTIVQSLLDLLGGAVISGQALAGRVEPALDLSQALSQRLFGPDPLLFLTVLKTSTTPLPGGQGAVQLELRLGICFRSEGVSSQADAARAGRIAAAVVNAIEGSPPEVLATTCDASRFLPAVEWGSSSWHVKCPPGWICRQLDLRVTSLISNPAAL